MTTSNAPGVPCWIDLLTPDEAQSREFYSALFGWTAAEGSSEFGGYFMFMRNDVPLAGAMPTMTGEDTAGWKVYLAVDDARKTYEVAASSGGSALVEPMDVADMGTMAVVTDRAGARIGLWQADTFPGFSTRGELGAPAWFELHTQDYETNLGFYRDVFGWDTHTMVDTPDFRYTTLGENETATAGVMDASVYAPDGGASEWKLYIQVEDTDATVAQAIELGGAQVEAAQNSPYGRLAEIADSTGCRIRVMGPNLDS
jgi:hypothetical protein